MTYEKQSTNKTYHEGVPRHGGKELIEQIGETQLVDDPVITVTIDDGLVKVENNHNSRHFFFLFLWGLGVTKGMAKITTAQKEKPSSQEFRIYLGALKNDSWL